MLKPNSLNIITSISQTLLQIIARNIDYRPKFVLFPVDVRDTLAVVPSTKFVSSAFFVRVCVAFYNNDKGSFTDSGSYLCASVIEVTTLFGF
jgi:hypothetical protein